MPAAPSVTASLRLPDLAFPVHLLPPLSEAVRLAVHGLPPYEEAPSGFVPVETAVRIRHDVRRLRLAVFRSASPGLFVAVPNLGTPDEARALADRPRVSAS
jgi:hypothetical protein